MYISSEICSPLETKTINHGHQAESSGAKYPWEIGTTTANKNKWVEAVSSHHGAARGPRRQIQERGETGDAEEDVSNVRRAYEKARWTISLPGSCIAQ